MENFKHTLKGAWVAVRAKATKSDSIEAYAFLRKQHKLAKLNQIKSRYPVLPEAFREKNWHRKKMRIHLKVARVNRIWFDLILLAYAACVKMRKH